MSRWSPERVRGVAPDEGSLKAARALARPGPWSETGATETLLWGRCQGSGSTPYQVSIDLLAPAYTCSCPSRKFPCKHALALLLLWSHGHDIAEVSTPSAFAAEWSRRRAEREAAAAARTADQAAEAPRRVDTEARAARVEARLATMDAGIAEFAIWLQDLVRGGAAAARSGGVRHFDAAAARLVDAQCPGLATEVRDAPEALFSGADWSEATLRRIARWWTIVRAWQRRDVLTDDEAADVRVALGWSRPTDEIRTRDPVCDTWLVLAVRRVDQGRIAEQRTWLRGVETDTTTLVLDFAVGQPLPVPHAIGATLDGCVALYPGSQPRRALFVDSPVPGSPAPYPRGTSLTDGLEEITRHRAANPLALRTPLLLRDVVIGPTTVADASGALPLAGPTPRLALAVSGGRPVTCFGEWVQTGFVPLAVVADGEVVGCA